MKKTRRLDLTGNRYFRLMALRLSYKTSPKSTYWECICDCGNIVHVHIGNLRSGQVKSCGCLLKETSTKRGHDSATHGMSKTVEFRTWIAMIDRCRNPNTPCYKNYGGRGISVCERWSNDFGFENFLEDMGRKPKGMTLERTDNNKGYSPDNCEWASTGKQAGNKRNTLKIEVNGEVKTLKELSELYNINYSTLWTRLRRGKHPDKLFGVR